MEVSKFEEQETLFDIEILSDEEVRLIQGGETILYWLAYYAGQVAYSVSKAAEKRPNDPYTYAQTYKMGSF